jgi:asparagine synthetase B (glutamine-hydrolysing)
VVSERSPMPGLFGIVALDGAPSPAPELPSLLERMAQTLRHDDAERLEQWTRPGLYLGRIGLAHVNPVPWPKDGLFVGGVLHATPVSDRHEEKNTDPLDVIRNLRGFFHVVLHDGGVTVLAADRHASLPVYYAQANGMLLFAPEIKALLACPLVERTPDPGALGHFLACGFLPRDLTLFHSICRLRGGQALTINAGQVRLTEYWRYRPAARVGPAGRRELEETFGDLVEKAVARNLDQPEKTVLFLSGGYDSRAILGACLKVVGQDRQRIQTVSWGKDSGPDDSDVAVAQLLAKELGLRHTFLQRSTDDYEPRFREVNHLVDAQSEIAAFHPHEYVIMKELRARGFERVLRGDECYGWAYHVNGLQGALAICWTRRLRDAVNSRDFLLPGAHADFCAGSDAVMDALVDELKGMAPDEAKDYMYFSARLQGYLNTASYYKRCLLDQRNVLLDENILDFLELLPARLRFEKNLFCSAMRRRFPELYRYPMARTHNLEDWAELLARASPVRAFALRELADEASGIWQWFDRQACLRFLDELPRRQERPARGGLKGMLTRLFFKLPGWMQAPVRAWKAGRPAYRLAPEYVLLRILTLKDWHDTLLSGRVAS